MALDGTLLRQIRHELEGVLIGARIDKIHRLPRGDDLHPAPAAAHRRRRAQRQAVSFCRSGQPAAAP